MTWQEDPIDEASIVAQNASAFEHTILLIDDNEIQVSARKLILERAGFHIATALDPHDALTHLLDPAIACRIALVITDHLMAAMIGSDFVRELRASHPNLPVLVITGFAEAVAEYDGLNIHFRVKPLFPDQLIETVHHLIQPSIDSSIIHSAGFSAH
jgi:DNA-binding NtrC family response regulator